MSRALLHEQKGREKSFLVRESLQARVGLQPTSASGGLAGQNGAGTTRANTQVIWGWKVAAAAAPSRYATPDVQAFVKKGSEAAACW